MNSVMYRMKIFILRLTKDYFEQCYSIINVFKNGMLDEGKNPGIDMQMTCNMG